MVDGSIFYFFIFYLWSMHVYIYIGALCVLFFVPTSFIFCDWDYFLFFIFLFFIFLFFIFYFFIFYFFFFIFFFLFFFFFLSFLYDLWCKIYFFLFFLFFF